MGEIWVFKKLELVPKYTDHTCFVALVDFVFDFFFVVNFVGHDEFFGQCLHFVAGVGLLDGGERGVLHEFLHFFLDFLSL